MQNVSLLDFFSPEGFHYQAPAIETYRQPALKQGHFLNGNTGHRSQSGAGQHTGDPEFFRPGTG